MIFISQEEKLQSWVWFVYLFFWYNNIVKSNLRLKENKSHSIFTYFLLPLLLSSVEWLIMKREKWKRISVKRIIVEIVEETFSSVELKISIYTWDYVSLETSLRFILHFTHLLYRFSTCVGTYFYINILPFTPHITLYRYNSNSTLKLIA